MNPLVSLHAVMLELIAANKKRTALLIGAFVLVIVALGAAIGFLAGNGIIGIVVAFAVAALMSVGSYWKADAIALSVSRAVPADPVEYKRLHNLVEGLCIASGLPKPRVFVVHDPAPNAFATGRNPKNASLAVTTGLLDSMNRVELEGVVAHELAHIRNYDILLSTVAVTLVGNVALAAEMTIRLMWWNGGRSRRDGDRADRTNPIAWLGFAMLMSAPLLGRLMQVSISRRRESLADASACQITRYPPGMVAALEKLRDNRTVTHSATAATAHLWMAQPLSGVGDDGRLAWFHRLFATHPPMEDRIGLLREL